MWKQFCIETTLHGFHELYSARSKCASVIWFMVIACGCVMTCLQVYYLIGNFYDNPTKTQITILPENVDVQYPMFIIRFEHFCYWVNVTKLKQYDFDLETFLYAMSYFQEVHSPFEFNVTVAQSNLKSIMRKHGIGNLYDLGMALSLDKPSGATAPDRFNRYLSVHGAPWYVVNMGERLKESMKTNNFSSYTVNIKSFRDFKLTEFSQDFVKYFNCTLKEEYQSFKRQQKNECQNISTCSTLFPITINPPGSRTGFINVDVSRANYEFQLKGTLYNWRPSNGFWCQYKNETMFFTDCSIKCSQQFPLVDVTSSKLFFVNNISDPHSARTSFGDFDKTLMGSKYGKYNKSDFLNCLLDCTSGCSQWSYDLSQIIYPKEILGDTFAETNDILGYVLISFDLRNNVLMITMLPVVTWEEALAGVGGLLGLWLGGSIISFVQILYVFCCRPLEGWIRGRRMFQKSYNGSLGMAHYFSRKTISVATSCSVEEHTAETKLQKLMENDLKVLSTLYQQQDTIDSLKREIDSLKAAIHPSETVNTTKPSKPE